jgi:hypothetical protein
MFKDFSEVDNIIINDEVFTTSFTCDLNACKGACCTMPSEFGAPITKKEINIVEKILDVIYDYLPEENVNCIKENGFWEEKYDDLMIKSIKSKDCVFSYYEGDVAKCAIEKAYFDDKIDFRKPISCHLFPIRINDFGGPVLKFEEYDECKPALKLGEKTGISVLEFCKDALIRAYGEDFYSKLVEIKETK